MKKVIFVLALALGSMTAFAQNTENVEAAADEVVAQDDFAEIAAEELPEAVTAAVAKNYPTATIDKAFVNEAKQFKLEVSLEDGTSGTLYADESGNWIEM
ncbi:hypothetical protein N9954_01475 [Maribacter sp.]|nr:hypothetical protein [Maribacter sp.]